jgi:hypothetical protein
MTQGAVRISAAVLFAAATVGAAVTDGLMHTSTRPWAGALGESLPALVLGAAVSVSARRGRQLFAVAMLLLAGGIVATAGVQPEGIAIGLSTLFAVSALLAAAFLRARGGAPGRHGASWLLVPLLALAAFFTAAAIGTARSLNQTKCGVDNCAFAGVGIALTVGLAFELTLLALVVAAAGAHPRAAAGAALFAIGLNLLLAVAPAWSQYQGVAGVAVGYAGLGLAAVPWLTSRRARESELLPHTPGPAL